MQTQITTLTQAPQTLSQVLHALVEAPARLVTDLVFRPWRSGAGGVYLATMDDGEVLEAHDAQVAATLGVAYETGRRVQVVSEAEEVIVARLLPTTPVLAFVPRRVPSELARDLELSLVVEGIAQALYRADLVQGHPRAKWPGWASVPADAREFYRVSARAMFHQEAR